MSRVGRNIKKIRNVKGLSQQAFADLFQLTRGNISSYEELRAEPKIEIIVNIAKYFGIPLDDFILKELSVNELLRFDSSLVTDMENLKQKDKFVEISYVSSTGLKDYMENYNNLKYQETLPKIQIPNNSPFPLIAFEVDNSISFPEGFKYKTGDILILEKVGKGNLHSVASRLGVIIGKEEGKIGVYEKKDSDIFLVLNDWVKYEFNVESSDSVNWVLRSVYLKEV